MEYVVGLQKDNQEGKYKLLYVICYLKYFYYIRRYVCTCSWEFPYKCMYQGTF